MHVITPGQKVLGIYVCEQVVGRGGMAEVWRARHELLGTHFALKVLTEFDHHTLQMFQREAQTMSQLSHRNLVRILDYGVLEGGEPCIAMELVPGRSIHQILKDDGHISWRRAVPLIRHVLAGLAALHGAGVLHRDIKPGNLIVTPGTPESLKIIDLGVSCLTSKAGAKRGRASVVVGTPGYIAPEVLAGEESDERSDLYAVGAVMRDMLLGMHNGALRETVDTTRPSQAGPNSGPTTREEPVRGRRPYVRQPGDTPAARELDLDVVAKTAADLDGAPATLMAALNALLSVEPQNRPPTAQAAAALLARVRTGHSGLNAIL